LWVLVFVWTIEKILKKNDMTLINEFIQKKIDEKKQQRWVVESNDLFIIFKMMDIMDNSELLMDILEYLEDNKIDIQFQESLNHKEYKTFKQLEQGFKLRKVFKSKSVDIRGRIEKVMSIKPDVDDTFLLEYRTEQEEEIEKVKSLDENIIKFQNKIKEEVRNKMIENLPQIDKSEIENLRNNP
jgi:hypothetical protein